MKVALRCDASSAIGFGHVKRSLALADELRAAGAAVQFVARRSDVGIATLVAAHGIGCTVLDGIADAAHDAVATSAALAAWRPALVVVDHYGLAAPWHRQVRRALGARIAAIDDLADRALDADLLIDHNPAPDHRVKYAAVLEREPLLCTGPRYALLDAIYARTPRRPFSAVVQAVGIFMGATDPGNHSALAWRALRVHAHWGGPVQLATTSANPHLAALQAIARADPLLALQIDQPDLAAFHSAHDLQIGAGGGALWERCALGTPTLALVCVAHQRLSVPLLAAGGVVAGFDAVDATPPLEAALGRCIARLIESAAERRALHERSLALVDGRGAARVAEALLSLQPLEARITP